MRAFLESSIFVFGRLDIGRRRVLSAAGLEVPGIPVSLALIWAFKQRGVALPALRSARSFLKDYSLWALANSQAASVRRGALILDHERFDVVF